MTALMSTDQTAANETIDMPGEILPKRRAHSVAAMTRKNREHVKFTSIDAQTVSQQQARHSRTLFSNKKRKAKRPTDFGPCFTLMDSSLLAESCACPLNREDDNTTQTAGENEGDVNNDFRGSKLSLISSDSDWSEYGSNDSECSKVEKKQQKVFSLQESVI